MINQSFGNANDADLLLLTSPENVNEAILEELVQSVVSPRLAQKTKKM